MLWDLAFAARALRRSPVFTLTAALTIGLGIGASTAIFSVANAVLLRPLPYKDPQQLVVLYADLRARNNLGMPISAENYADLRNGTKDAFEDMAAVNTGRQIVPGADGTRSEEHTSELQSRPHLVCRLLLEKKKIHTRETIAR